MRRCMHEYKSISMVHRGVVNFLPSRGVRAICRLTRAERMTRTNEQRCDIRKRNCAVGAISRNLDFVISTQFDAYTAYNRERANLDFNAPSYEHRMHNDRQRGELTRVQW